MTGSKTDVHDCIYNTNLQTRIKPAAQLLLSGGSIPGVWEKQSKKQTISVIVNFNVFTHETFSWLENASMKKNTLHILSSKGHVKSKKTFRNPNNHSFSHRIFRGE